MLIHKVRPVPLAALRPNPDNPKQALGARYRKGLQASLKKYGLADVLVVADNLDGTFMILNGNTRYEELLEAEDVEDIPCIVMDDMAGRPADPDVIAKRRLFAVSFDRHRKLFNEDMVIDQLRALNESNHASLKELQELSGVERLSQVLSETQSVQRKKQQEVAAKQTATMIVQGPADVIADIRSLLKTVKMRMSESEKIRSLMAQMGDYVDWTEERIAVIALGVLARMNDE